MSYSDRGGSRNVPARQDNFQPANALEAVIANGDLASLSAEQRVHWYLMRCEAAGLDPKTQPFQYITLQGKLTLYATKAATDQLCRIHGITAQIVRSERIDDVYVVTCRGTTTEGRFTEDIGAVVIGNLKGDALANALMKATTKAKRRTILSLCGLGMMDESEADTVPGAVRVPVHPDTGEVVDVAGRVTQTLETEPSYSGASVAQGEEALKEQAKRRIVRRCMDDLRIGAEPDLIKFLAGRILGKDVPKFGDLSSLEMKRVDEVLLTDPARALSLAAEYRGEEPEQAETLPLEAEGVEGVPSGFTS